MNPKQYFDDNNLWDIGKLKTHAQENLVKVITSERFPRVVMLHYADEAVWDNNFSPFAKMSRGLIVDMQNKQILAWPFEKFYNMDQVPETYYNSLLSLGRFQTSEKLDGSMIILFKDPNTNKLTFTTKGSFDSDHAQYANSLQMASGFWETAEVYAKTGTLIFELISKQFQIVIDYQKKQYKEGLYLIGYRDHDTNELESYEDLSTIASDLGVPTFKTYSFNSLDDLIDNSKTLPLSEEGYVLRFDETNLMVKVKGPAYLEMHRFISNLSDGSILDAYADGKEEDLIKLCPDEFHKEVEDKINSFKVKIANLKEKCYTRYEAAPKGMRKDFAIWVIENVEPYLKNFLFNIFDKKEPLSRKELCRVLKEVENIKYNTRF